VSFKDFVEETTVTKQGVYALNKGIPHLEDLSPRDFLNVIENIAAYTITEKLDGANLVVGFDNDGTMYTSRSAKGGDKHYTMESYPNRPANNGFRQAHGALENVEGQLRGALDCGESVEMEILYGRQPNAIIYGSNHIAFLRMVPGNNGEAPDQSKLIKLKGALEGFTTHVTSSITTTRDGMDLYEQKITEAWKFANAPTVDPVKFVTVKLVELDAYKTWLKVRPWPTMTHEDVYNCKLNRIKKADLPEGITKANIKDSRTLVREMVLEQHLQQKACFIDLLRKLEPTFRDVHLEGTERNIGIEGVVLRHPETGEQVKIVDKDGFTIINQFNHAIRNEIRSTSGIQRRFEATLERDIDIYTGLLREFEKSLGVEGLGRLTSIKRVIKKHSGNTLNETIGNFTAAFKNQNVESLIEELSESIVRALLDLAYCHGKYLLERYSYTLTLPTGRTIRYTNEINKRTELMFAETRKELKDMRSQVEFAETLEDIAQALYGKQLNSL
jgi:hypothetical protein